MISINHDHVTANALTESHTVKSDCARRSWGGGGQHRQSDLHELRYDKIH